MMVSFQFSFLFAFSLPYVWSAATHTHDASFIPDAVLRISAQNVSIGGIQRYTTLVNGSVPGPEVRIPEGETVWIRVYNDMSDMNATMHWHGLAQAAYPFSDGTPLASQWPIPPEHFFDYELQIANGSAGSYFYHSHVGFQTVSASGPLIIEDAATAPYKTDGERTIYLQELFNKTDATIEQGLVSTPLGWSGETNGVMVNGKTISNWGLVDNSSAKLDVISVEPGKTYRFRFIAATSLSLAIFQFESHGGLQVIEADGDYTKPVSTDVLQMGTGQRFSALFTAKSCAELQASAQLDYYMQIETRARPTVVRNYALLRYNNTCGIPPGSAKTYPANSYPATAPLQLPPQIDGFLDYKLQPLRPNSFPLASEVTRRVIINVQQINDQYSIWQDANVSWVENATDPLPHTSASEPYLVALYKNESAYLPSYSAAIVNGGVDPTTKAFPGRLGEVLEIVFQQLGAIGLNGSQGGGMDVHPFHAHGAHYYDAGAGQGAFDPSVMEAQLNGTQPVRRDTTVLYRYNATTAPGEKHGWRAWRLRVTEPGVWMIHCHTLQHMLMGMQTVWVFGDTKDILGGNGTGVAPLDLEGYLTYGGNVVGNATHAPEVVHFGEVEKLRRRRLQVR